MKDAITIGDWDIDCNVDDDGHLTVGINHKDGSKVDPLNVDIATNDQEWVERFTTAKIEEDYLLEHGHLSSN